MGTSKELEEVKSVFSGNVPLIFSVMEANQLLPLYWPVVKHALFDPNGIQDRRVTEGLMVALSTRCDNEYCFVAHSFFLHRLGFTVETIGHLVDKLEFPEQMAEHEKWSAVLKWSFFFGHPPSGSSSTGQEFSETIRKLISAEERRHLYKICTAISILNQFSEYYSDQVRIENEPMFLDESANLQLPIPNLAKYYERVSESRSDESRRVVVICMYCKKIRDAAGKWHALESVLPALTGNCSFSHSICSDCSEEDDED